MILVIKHIITFITTIALACVYGYLSSQCSSDAITVLISFAYTSSIIALYIYVYDAVNNKTKWFGVVYTFCSTAFALYIAWVVWVIVRSDDQFYLFYNPLALWQNLMTLAADSNVILVHNRYTGMGYSADFLYLLWTVEVITTVGVPTLFAIQAITAYSDNNISTSELHNKFDESI